MWYNDYVGIPFLRKGREATGADCWGLVRLVYKEEFNIELPSFADDYEYDDTERIEQLAAQYKEGWEETTSPKPGSVVLFKVLGHLSHVGVYIGGNKFLHCRENHSSAIENLDSVNWNKRFGGFYNYVEKSAAVLNAVPHPLRTERWTVPVTPGTTVEQLSNWVLEKFMVSPEIESSVTIIRNGVVVPKEAYSTTIILDNDTLEYRAVPGKSFIRIALLIAVMVVAVTTAQPYLLGAQAGLFGMSAVTTGAVISVGISTLGSMLIGYLMPIRPPSGPKDPGTAQAQLLISGGSNQVSKYAAIPVVLGRVRMTPLLGGESYIDSNTNDSYLNMLLVWGFGPLDIDKTSLRVGLNPFTQYQNGAGIPIENYHLNDAFTADDSSDILNFNAIYGSDRQQVYVGTTLTMHTSPVNVNEVNVPDDGLGPRGPWIEATLNQPNTVRIDVNIHFPQGLRQLRIAGKHAGDINELLAQFQVQIKRVDKNGKDIDGYTWGSATMATIPATTIIANKSYDKDGPNGADKTAKYQWTRIGIGISGLQVKVGPRCVAINSQYGQGGQEAYGVTGGWYDEFFGQQHGGTIYSITDGGVRLPEWSADVVPLADICMYGSQLISNATVDYGIKLRQANKITGMNITTSGIASVNYDIANWINPSTGVDTGDKLISIAEGTYARAGGNIITLGTMDTGGRFVKRKDAFSFTVSKAVAKLPYEGYYKVRVRRLTDDKEDDIEEENKLMHTMVFQTATATADNRPIREGTNWRLTKSAIRIKANDQLNSRIEGINAIVQTICPDWDSTTSTWVPKATNNPASLFLYILRHPANAYRIADGDLDSKVNKTALQAWHVFCASNKFTFNSVVSSQTSILDILKDICAAGRASPAMVDGKWTVIIDEQKPDIIQHFTPHNSWGFEASKRLPKQPHALRVNYFNANSDYQEDEKIIYNTGYNADGANNKKAAEIFEQINLPGITDADTVVKHARWHLAQAALRPEIYTINTDLEYLVCNRGDRVKVMHDVPLWGIASARISNRITTSVPTSITGTGTVATATVISQNYPLYAVGTSITISGSPVVGYNGTKTVTACTPTTVSWSDTTSALATIATSRTISTTSISTSSSTATATFAAQGYIPYAVGSYIIIAGVTPDTYNGRVQVTDCTATTVSWADTVTTTSATVQGTVTGTVIPSITSADCSVFQLDEDIPLETSTNDSYTIRVRSKTGGTSTWNINKVALSGYYNTVQISAYTTAPASAPTKATAAQIDVNDLVMIGKLNQEAQDLLVLAIEPFGNQNAKITLVDYAAGLFDGTVNFNTDFEVPEYKANITLPPKNLVQSIFYTPTITSIISDETVMEQVSSGNFKINIKVGFTNPPGLPTDIQYVAAEVDSLSDSLDNWETTVAVLASQQSITIMGVDELSTYRIRLRYLTRDGRTGPWQSAIGSTVASTAWGSGSLIINTVSRHSFSVGTPVYLYNAQGTSLNNIYTVDSVPSRTSLSCIVAPIPATSISSTAGTTTVSFATREYTPFPVGSQITVVGTTPAEYNISAIVTASGTSSVSYTGPSTAATSGTIVLSVTTTAITQTGGVATATFEAQNYLSFAPGSSVTISGATPSGFNGTFVITESTSTTISWASSVSGPATVQGTIIRAAGVGSWVTSNQLQANQSLTTGQGLVSSKNNVNNTFLAENLQHKVIGKTSPPGTVTNFGVAPNYNLGLLNLSWTANGEIDVQYYEVRTDQNWGLETGRVFYGAGVACTAVPAAVGVQKTYYIKAIDYSLNYSINYASAAYTVVIPPTVTDTPSFLFNNTSLVDTNVVFSWAMPVDSNFFIERYELTLVKPGVAALVQEVKGTTWVTPANWVGTATLTIKSIDILGNKSVASSSTPITKDLPASVSSASIGITPIGTGLGLKWAQVNPIPTGMAIAGYEIRTADNNWGTAAGVMLYSGSANNTTIDIKNTTSETTLTYYIKAYDADDRYSSLATSFTYTVAKPVDTSWSAVPFVFGENSLTAATITLNWNAASPVFGLYGYELSYTTTGGVATTRILNTTSIVLNASAIWNAVGTGPVTFTIKVIDNLNVANKSVGVTTTVTKSAPSAITNLAAKVIDNNVLLSWTLPAKTSLPIDHVSILKGNTYETAVNIGDKTGTFTIVFEQTGGNFTYWAVAVDTDGQVSATIKLDVLVASPPDYVFNAAYSSIFANVSTVLTNTTNASANVTVRSTEGIYTGMQIILSGTVFGGLTAGYWYVVSVLNSTTITISNSSALTPIFLGTSTASGSMTLQDATGAAGINDNSLYDSQGIVMPVDTTATFATHFASGAGRTWTGPDEQKTYFPIFIQPGKSSGYYEEVYNYTKPLASSQITMTYTGTSFNAPAITPMISTASSVSGGSITVSNTANSTTVTSSASSPGLVVGNFITVPAATGQTVRVVSVTGTVVTVAPAIVAANAAGTAFSYAGSWTDYTGTAALGTAFQYVKAKISVAQATRNAGLVTITAPGGTGAAVTITNYTGNATATVTGTVASTAGWSTGDKITITGATGTEQIKLNGTWIITVLTGTTFSFVVTTAVATGALTTTLGTTTKSINVTVTGATGTLFTKTFKAGDVITIPNTALGVDYLIASITSDTVLSATIPGGVTMPAYSTATSYAYKGTDIYKLTSLGVKLDAKQKSESGMVVVSSSDGGGTIVNFSSTFIDVASITLASQGTTAVNCVYNFSDTNVVGTYTVSGTTTCTVNVTGHGLVASTQQALVTFTSGTAPSGRYPITFVNANQFTIALPAALTTSGTVSVYPNSMTVYAFDSGGNRISIPNPGVSWTVRGF